MNVSAARPIGPHPIVRGGGIDSAMHSIVNRPVDRHMAGIPTEDQLAYAKGRTPWPRLDEPEDVASAALFLASPEATYITGENLMVDGGWMAG